MAQSVRMQRLEHTVSLCVAWWPRARTLAERKRVLRELVRRSENGLAEKAWRDALVAWSRSAASPSVRA